MNYNAKLQRTRVSKNLILQTQNAAQTEYMKDRVKKKSYSATHEPYSGTPLSPENIKRKLSGKVEKHVEI